jgi:hypothetical protein
MIKDTIKEGRFAESWMWKANEEEDSTQQGVAPLDSKEVGKAKVAHKDTLKHIEKLFEYFGQKDDTLYSDAVQL